VSGKRAPAAETVPPFLLVLLVIATIYAVAAGYRDMPLLVLGLVVDLAWLAWRGAFHK
jgi:hypothetical protein